MRNISRSLRLLAIAALLLAGMPRAGAQTAGVGQVHFANSGAPGAQTAFLSGLAQLHNFEYDAAATLFREAQKTDPGFAMAYWGEAMTYNHAVWMQQDRAAALKALERLGPTPAARSAKAKTPREQDYLKTVEILYGDGDKNARDFAYADAMASLHAKYPDDPDAATFYALALLGTAHEGRDFATYMRAAAVAEPVFRQYPNHPGAAHYLIHSYDDPIHAPLGLPAARAYSKIAPAAGHAQHMTSHIFVAMGMWDDVVAANEAAVKVVDAGREMHHQAPTACGHYLSWLEYGYLQQGRFKDAKALVLKCQASAAAGDASAAGAFASMRARYLIDTDEWSGDVASLTAPAGRQGGAQVTTEYINGLAALRLNDQQSVRAALDKLTAARKALDTPTADQSAVMRARILEQQLSALFSVGGSPDAAIETLRAAANSEDKMPFEFGPPFIDKPTFELLGEVLLLTGKAKDARVAFEKALARTPERTAALAGLMHAAEMLGDHAKATAIKARLTTIWRRADKPIGNW